MPTPAVTLKLKRFRRRFGITAPRVVVRSHLSWRWYAAGALLTVVLAVVVAGLFIQRGEAGAMADEIEGLRARNRAYEDELLVLRSTAGTEGNLVQVERAMQQQLLSRIRGLEGENAALKEDLKLFERLVSSPSGESEVRLESARVYPVGGDQYRYRLLLAFSPSKQLQEFRGRLQLNVVYLAAGKEQRLALPAKGARAQEYQMEVRHFLRKEGGFELPPGATLRSVEVRIFQGDTLKAERVVNP